MVDLVLRNPANGAVVFDANTTTTHIRASFTAEAGGGTRTVPDLDQGIPFVLSATPVSGSGIIYPDFSFSGNSVSWTSTAQAVRVIIATHS